MNSWKKFMVLKMLVLILAFLGCKQNSAEQTVKKEGNSNISSTDKQATSIVIIVPEDMDAYQKMMIDHVQAGGPDPLEKIQFVKKEIEAVSNVNQLEAAANAAAAEIGTGGGPDKAEVGYFKQRQDSIYILLNIDKDGWAGVSVARAQIHPLVEKTLLNFPEVKSVTFGYAKGDEKKMVE